MDRMKRFARKTVSYVVAMTMVFSMMQMSVFAQGETVSSEPTTTAVSDQNSVTAETENNNANTSQTNEESPPASNEATESTKVEEKTDANKSSGEDPSAAQKAAEEKAKAEKEAAEKAEAEKKAAEEKAAAEKKAAEEKAKAEKEAAEKAEAEKKAAEEKAAAEKKAAEEKAKAEKEAAEKAEAEKKAAENAMPAQTFTGSTSQLKVTASVDANVFPNGTEMKVTPVSSTVAKNIAKKTVKDDKVITDAIGADITFYKDGKELQPADANAVHVSMTLNKSLDGQNFKVVHQKDNGTIEKMDASVNDHKATFNAKSFSIYVISTEKPLPISTYKFYNGDTIISEYTQKIKAGDTLKQPTSPEKTGYKFLGWATTKNATEPNFTAFEKYDEVEEKEYNIYAVFEEVHYVFFMAGAEGEDATKVAFTKEGINGQKIEADEISKVKLGLASNQSIEGWYYDKAFNEKVDSITIGDQNIRVYPKILTGHYIIFDSKGGSYIEPHFVKGDDKVSDEDIPKPEKNGYTFKRWLTKDGEEYQYGHVLTEDLKLHAEWQANEDTKYTVIYWQENANDDKYSYHESEEKHGVTGSEIDISSINKSYDGFTQKIKKTNEANKDVTISGDGSTIINVYYDRNEYSVTKGFPKCGTIYSFTLGNLAFWIISFI